MTETTPTPRLVAVDVDGTFLDSQRSYDAARFAAVHRRLHARGIRFAVASGNQYWSLRALLPEFTGIVYVGENGGVIGQDEDVWQTRPWSEETARATLAAVDGLPGVRVLACGAGAAWLRTADATAEELENIHRYYVRVRTVDSWGEVEEPLVKLALSCPPERTGWLLETLHRDLPAGSVPTSSGHGSVDVIPHGVNKASSLALVGRRLGIPLEAMAAFGDGGNDREMLEEVGIGVAMGNAPEEIRAAADEVTGTNDEQGVLVWLERMLDRLDADGAGEAPGRS